MLTEHDIDTLREARHLADRMSDWRQVRNLDATIRKLAATPAEVEVITQRLHEGEVRG